MPTLAITGATAPVRPGQTHPQATLIDDAGRRFTFPFMPREVAYDGGIPEWAQLARPGTRKPVLRRAGTTLRSMTLAALIARPDHQASVEDLLSDLGEIIKAARPVTFSAGPAAAGVWRITTAATKTELLREGDNAITRAVVDLVLTEVSDGPRPPVMAPKARPKYHVVKAGDTLKRIATRYYGTPAKWTAIATANKIRRAAQLKVGMRLKLPAG